MVILKAPWEIELIRKSCRVVAEILAELKGRVRPGITTRELDRVAEEMLRARGATAAFKGYRGYPCALCTSVNEVVVHGIPSTRVLREGDIIGLDFGAVVEGYYGDAAVTVPVGGVSEEAARLMRVTEESLWRGIAAAQEGTRLSDISHAVQSHAEGHGYSVVRVFVGHGVGRALHEEPQVPNYGSPGHGPLLKCGMVLAIEPMVNRGSPEVTILQDKWTAVSRDGSLSAHFEHTIALTEKGTEVLTALTEA